MAKNDYVLKLSADNKELQKAFDQAIKQIKTLNADNAKLKQSVQKSFYASTGAAKNFASEINKISFGALIKQASAFNIAGIMGIAAKSVVSFSKEALNAGQKMDGFNQTCAAAKSTVVTFMDSLMRGDWSIFNKGIFDANKELEAMRDTLGDVMLSYDYVKTKSQRALSELKEVSAAGSEATKQEKQEALKIAKEAKADLSAVTDRLLKQIASTLAQTTKAKGSNYSMEDLERMVSKSDVYDDINAEKKRVDENRALLDRVNANEYSPSIVGDLNRKKDTEALAVLNPGDFIYNYSLTEREQAEFWQTMNDEARKGVSTQLKLYQEAYKGLADFQKQFDRANRQQENQENATVKNQQKDIINPGSIRELQEKAKKIKEKIENSPDSKIRFKAEIDLNRVENDIKNLQAGLPKGLAIPVASVKKEAYDSNLSPMTMPSFEFENADILHRINESWREYQSSSENKIELINQQADAFFGLANSVQQASQAFRATDTAFLAIVQAIVSIGEVIPAAIAQIMALSARQKPLRFTRRNEDATPSKAPLQGHFFSLPYALAYGKRGTQITSLPLPLRRRGVAPFGGLGANGK